MTLNRIFSRVVTLAIVALLGAAGVHWYLQHKVESVLQDIIKELYPIAVIKYEDTNSSLLNSSIGVEKLTINPRAVRDEIAIESIIFQVPNLKFLIDAKSELKNGNIPKKLRISINGLSINTDGGIARSIDKNTPPPSLGARDNAYGCANIKQFKFYELGEMGYDRLNTDLTLNYEYNSMLSELYVTALWSNRQMFELEITGTFEVEDHEFKLDQIKSLSDEMSNMKISYRDLGYNQRTIDYCNHNRGDHDYISAHIEAFKQDLKDKLSIIPSSALVESYRAFMMNSGVIDISSHLQHTINPKYLALYNPKDAVLLLRPDITVNGQPVDIPYADLLKAADDSNETQPEKDDVAEKDIVLKPRITTEFVDIGITQLAQYIGDMVRIQTKQGVTRTGILIDVDTKKILVEVSHRGGAITYPIEIKSITNTEVMELPPAYN